MTVSRTDRKSLAHALRRLATGRITNFEFEDAIPFSTSDFGVKNVVRETWYLYSDLREHRLRGADSLTREGRREVARWLLFLDTELDYEWPDPRGIWPVLLLPFNVASVGLAGVAMRWYLARRGDLDAWPFIRHRDLAEAMQAWPRGRAS